MAPESSGAIGIGHQEKLVGSRESKVSAFCLAVFDDHGLRGGRSVFFLPGNHGVTACRKTGNLKRTVIPRHSVKGISKNTREAMHPTMNIAFEFRGRFSFGKLFFGNHTLIR